MKVLPFLFYLTTFLLGFRGINIFFGQLSVALSSQLDLKDLIYINSVDSLHVQMALIKSGYN